MQDFDWDDLKFLLALQRVATLTEAGRLTGVDESTVSRRLKRLESLFGTPLIVKRGSGRYEVSDEAATILHHAENMEQDAMAIRDRLGLLAGKVAGTVRISSVPFIINRILIPNLPALQAANPELVVELLPEAKNVDLTKREADMAIRFSRPDRGGLDVKAQKLGDMAFDLFCAAELPAASEADLSWIGYDETNASLPQARWIESLCSAEGESLSALRVADLDSALEAVVEGHGKSALPRSVCSQDDRLRTLIGQNKVPQVTRPVWLLAHASHSRRRPVVAVKKWICGLCWT